MTESNTDTKNLLLFLLITFAFAWALFLLPLSVGAPGSTDWQKISLITWSVAMWAPGLAAIFVTRFVEKKPLSTLNLRRLGPIRVYLWAWLLPILLTVTAGVLSWITGVGKLDLELKAFRQAMDQVQGVQVQPTIILLAQTAVALTVGPLFNTLFALGEELGWRGYLLVKLEKHGQMGAIALSGLIWGIWHAPVILQGHNYPQHPFLGVFLMVVFCVLFGAILSWFYLRSRSPWSAALGHGSLNAVAGLPLLFMPEVDLAFGGSVTSILGWVPLIIFICWLLLTKRLPVPEIPPSEDISAAP